MRENRIETVLAYMAAGVIGTSVLSLLTILISALFKFKVPQFVVFLPAIGLPLGFLLIVTLLVFSMIRKARANRN